MFSIVLGGCPVPGEATAVQCVMYRNPLWGPELFKMDGWMLFNIAVHDLKFIYIFIYLEYEKR